MKKLALLLKITLLATGIVLFFLNLSLITKSQLTSSPQGSIHLVIDISNSMNIKDIQGQSRLQKAIALSKDLITTGDTKYSLTIFSSTSNLLIPPTKDTHTFLNYLESLNTNLLPASWSTNILSPLTLIDNFAATWDQIIILSDFDFEIPTHNPLQKPYQLILIGLGSSRQHQVTDALGNLITFKGKTIKSKREDTNAKALASLLGGKYYINRMPENLSQIKSNSSAYFNYRVLIPLILIGLWL